LLSRGLRYARHPLLWISDSNTEATQEHFDCLLASYHEEKTRTGKPTLIHAPLSAIGGEGLGAAMERSLVATFPNVNHETSLLVGVQAVVGKSLLTSTDDLAAVGGLEAVGRYLAEDFVFGELYIGRGGQVRRTGVATRNMIDRMSLVAWFNRHQRWAVLRKMMKPYAYTTVELLTYPASTIPLAALGYLPWSWVGALFALKTVGDVTLYAATTGEKLRWIDIPAAALKEIGLVLVWFSALFTNHVLWRGRAMGLGYRSAILTTDASPSRMVRHWGRLKRSARTLSD
jgi:ceramide glucosyltransferase